MNHSTKQLSLIIPNWNGSQLLRSYLPQVIKHSEGTEIVVVDDASTDNSLEVLSQYPEVAVIPKKRREGFSSTVNLGVGKAHGEIIVLLNTDIEPEEGYLLPLLAHFRDPQVFAVGCMDKSIEGDNTVLRGRGITYWDRGFFLHRKGDVDKTDTGWVSCGSGAFRKSIWEKLGGLDPLFNPFYWEDIDLSYRARKAGYTILFEPKSVVVHHHAEGSIKEHSSASYVKRIAYRNQFLFIWKNISDPALIFNHFLWLPTHLMIRIFSADWDFVIGLLLALAKAGEALKQRAKVRKFWKKSDVAVLL